MPGPLAASSTGVLRRAISRNGRAGWPNQAASGLGGDAKAADGEHLLAQDKAASVLIFRLGEEWLAFRTQTVAEVTLPRPVHRVPHRSNSVLTGIVNLQGQVQLCVSLHGLLGATAGPAPAPGLSCCATRTGPKPGHSRPMTSWEFGEYRAASGAVFPQL